VLTPEGLLYEVDMRLRPSGSAGPIASSLAAFRAYHDALSWTWEHMALTRARGIAGDAALQDGAMALIREILGRPRDPDRLVVDVDDMRRRIAAQHPKPPLWEVKHLRGGLVDAEFIAQYLMLLGAAQHPEVIRANTSAALLALAEAGLLTAEAASALVAALKLWRQVQSALKLVLDDALDEATASPALKSVLARGAGAVDFDGLKLDMIAAAKTVLARYRAIVGRPAAQARKRLQQEENPT